MVKLNYTCWLTSILASLTCQLLLKEVEEGEIFSHVYSAYQWFADCKYVKWLDAFASVLEEHETNLGVRFFNYLKGPSLIQCNMFIGRKYIIDKYCKDLFRLLKEYDELVGLDETNLRIDGYIAEHFFGFWLDIAKVRLAKCDKLEMRFIKTGVNPDNKERTIY